MQYVCHTSARANGFIYQNCCTLGENANMAADRQHCVLIANIYMFLFSYIIECRSHLGNAVSGPAVTAVMDSLSLSAGAPSSMVKSMMVIIAAVMNKSKNNP
jgi:hypothetical protein